MASNRHEHRALVAGLSVGAGLAIPAAVFAATIPFDDAHAMVTTAALPFAAGSLVGVGIHALNAHIVNSHAEDLDRAHERAQARAQARSESAYVARREGVPVISRAWDAMSEEEAWADIDSMLEANANVSCDPINSKDIYQIALEEMARDAQEAAEAQQRAQAQAAQAPVRTAAPDTTDMFVALAGATPASQQSPAATSTFMMFDDLDEPDYEPAAEPVIDEVEVPMIDYSGHEDMWAAALAILDEEPVAAPVTASVAAPVAMSADPDATVMVSALDSTFAVAPERMQAMADGGRSTETHTHVNELLEEEFESTPSQSVRNQSREYLRVIQGGTISMPRYSAEA